MSTLSARSQQRFPSLAPSSCPWHEDCTPMDCEHFRVAPSWLDIYARPVTRPSTEGVEYADTISPPGSGAQGLLRDVKKAVPIKPSKRGRR